MDNREILVSVFVTAYNHEKYIRDALEGILMQKTTFKYEIVVHDDASTDETQDIIREYYEKYPDLIVPILREKNVHSINPNEVGEAFLKIAKGKYTAICEADDYWVDENKLEKQITFLEEHQDYSMCFTNAWKYDVWLDQMSLLNTFPTSGTYSLEEQVKLGLGSKFPATATYVWKTDVYRWTFEMLNYELETVGDYPARVLMATKGSIYYLNEATAVYRCGVNGSFSEKVRNNPGYYMDYFFGMDKMYGFLNSMLDYRFKELFETKLRSEYLGLASKISEEELCGYMEKLSDSQKSAFDQTLYRKCQTIIHPQNMENSLKCFIDENINKLYLYGTSPLAEKIYQKLRNNGVQINGFIISDGYSKPDEFLGKRTMYLSELAKTDEQVAIILSVQPINEVDIVDKIKNYNNLDYYSLFSNEEN